MERVLNYSHKNLEKLPEIPKGTNISNCCGNGFTNYHHYLNRYEHYLVLKIIV